MAMCTRTYNIVRILFVHVFSVCVCNKCLPCPSFQPPVQNPIQTAAKPTSAVDILAQKAIHPSVHKPLKVVVQPFLISTDLLYPGEKMSHSCVHFVPTVVLCHTVGGQ